MGPRGLRPWSPLGLEFFAPSLVTGYEDKGNQVCRNSRGNAGSAAGTGHPGPYAVCPEPSALRTIRLSRRCLHGPACTHTRFLYQEVKHIQTGTAYTALGTGTDRRPADCELLKQLHPAALRLLRMLPPLPPRTSFQQPNYPASRGLTLALKGLQDPPLGLPVSILIGQSPGADRVVKYIECCPSSQTGLRYQHAQAGVSKREGSSWRK